MNRALGKTNLFAALGELFRYGTFAGPAFSAASRKLTNTIWLHSGKFVSRRRKRHNFKERFDFLIVLCFLKQIVE